MANRKIIQIEEDKCNGCGLCVPNCAEGAIQIIDGKAKLVKDSYCDGLGACLGHCPQDALHVIEREADEFDEEEAMKFVASLKAQKIDMSENPVATHAVHSVTPSQTHAATTSPTTTVTPTATTAAKPMSGCNTAGHVHAQGGGGCPGSRMRMMNQESEKASSVTTNNNDVEIKIKPQLRQWPVQLSLVPVNAPYFENADLLVCADCVPFAYPNFHLDLLKGKVVVVGCPKLDNIGEYTEKLTDIFENNNLRSVTVAHMEVPCCSGIVRAVDQAAANSSKNIPIHKVRIGIDGEKTSK